MAIRLRSRLRAGSSLYTTAALSLDFLSPSGALDPRITFSRGSQATLTDSAGKITYAPNNLLTNSESFEASAWTKANATITANAALAPDGTTTADKLVPNTTSASHAVQQSVTTSGAVVISFYAKPAGYSYAVISSSANNYVYFDVANGVVASTAGTGWSSPAITSVGNGWYRCSAITSVANTRYDILCYNTTQASGNIAPTFAGDGTSGIFIWGAQFEQVTYQTTPGTYNSTTPKNLLGYTQEFDNAAWTKSNATVVPNQDPAVATLGSELVTNGDFSGGTTTGWTAASSATLSVVSGAMVVTNGATAFGYAYQAIATVPGKNYNVTFSVTGGTLSGNLYIGTTPGGFENYASPNRSVGTYTVYFTATAATTYLRVGAAANTSGGTVSFDNISAKELIGGLIVAPDGSTTADKLVEDTATNFHRAAQVPTLTAVPTTASIYAKAAERNWLYFANASSTQGAYFNLSTGAVGTLVGSATASITPVGNGWYRCSITSTPTAGAQNYSAYVANADASYIYTGNGTSGIYIWGAQLSNSASLDPYVYNPGAAPTSAAYYGPRFDYDPVTLAAKGLLIEEQRTNLPLYSEQFENVYWNKANSSVTANAAVSPDGSTNADKLVENTATSTHTIGVTLIAGSAVYTYSVYVKAAGRSVIRFRDSVNGVDGYFNLNTATSPSGTGVNRAITSVGNGWYRCTMTSSAAITNPEFGVRLATAVGTENYTGDGTSGVYLYGAQIEAGAFATSYIPTVASQVTRSADVATMVGANFSNWYNPNQGTLFTSASQPTIFASSRTAASVNDKATNRFNIYRQSAGGINGFITPGAGALASGGLATANVPWKGALAYTATDGYFTANGASVVSGSQTISLGSLFELCIGNASSVATENFCGHIRSVSYYNTRLRDDELQVITG